MSTEWIRAGWPAPENVVAGTTTRQGNAFDFPAEPQWLNQVHGTHVVHWGSNDFDNGPPDADAITEIRRHHVHAQQYQVETA